MVHNALSELDVVRKLIQLSLELLQNVKHGTDKSNNVSGVGSDNLDNASETTLELPE